MQFVIPLSRGGEPFFRQIYVWFRQAILRGTMGSRERLPSTRELAEQLHVSRTVVVLAYEHLLAEGFIVGRLGSGTYVSEGLATGRPLARTSRAKVRLSRFGSGAAEIASKMNFPGRRSIPLRYDFAYGRSDMTVFPFENWRRILLRHVRRASGAGI